MTREEIIARAEQHVRMGQSQIFRQHELILRQASRGAPTGLAVDMLAFYQSLQTIRDEQLDRFRAATEMNSFNEKICLIHSRLGRIPDDADSQ